MMIYGSICSGIEAATVAWHPLGWNPSFFSEIEKFPRAVLKHHYKDVPCHGDFTTIKENDYEPINLLVGGTPCQAFSVAGLRKGFADERGNLTLEFVKLTQRLRPKWLVWENVPGVLSAKGGGGSFGTFLAGLAECGYGFAYRVFDAQYFGLAQRRRRVFVVGYLGDWRPPAAVLFDSQSMSWNPAPRRETQKDTACFTPSSIGGYSEGVGTLRANGGDIGGGSENLITHTLRGDGFDASEDGTGRGTPLVPFAFHPTQDPISSNDICHAIGAQHNATAAVCTIGWSEQLNAHVDLAGTIQRGGNGGRHEGVMDAKMRVRRLMPIECERLQGFPDNYTRISEKTPDGARYKAIGNSMPVPVMRYIGERINLIEKLMGEL